MSERPFGNSQPSYGALSSSATPQRGADVEDLCRDISNKIFKINGQYTAIERIGKKLGTKDDNGQLRDRLHNILQETNQIVTEVAALLKDLYSTSHERNHRLQADRLKKVYQQAVERYGALQKKITDKARSVLLAATHQDDQVEDTWGEEAGLLEQQRRREELLQEQMLYEDELDTARDREERIHQLEGNVIDVNDIFKQLSEMVHDQGETIDRIEDNVTSAADNVDEGNVQLDKASTYQKSYKKKLLILVVILILVAGAVGVIIYVSIPKKK